MKSSQLKTLIKEAVKEAIQEELKDILLEAVKTPKVITHTPPPVMENITPIPPQQPQMSAEEKRTAYQNILGETGAQFTSANVPQSFTPPQGGSFDTSNGTLPAGEVDMSMIAGLMKK